MTPYDALIDPTNFGSIARYLDDPRSEIHYILHVKDERMLPEVAAKLNAAMNASSQGMTVALHSILDPLLDQGLLRISSRRDIPGRDPSHVIAASSVPKLAFCRVLYLPPFYLAHTPGLFEGTLVKPQVRVQHGPNLRIKP